MATLFQYGCATVRLRSLDRQAQAHLAAAQRLEFPERPVEAVDLEVYARHAEALPRDGTVSLDLKQALALAATHSRDYQSSRETLYQSALALQVTAHDWDWTPTNSLSVVLGRNLDVPDTTLDTDAGVGLTRRFSSGARLSAGLALDALRYLSGDHNVSISSLASLTVTQPLLRGFGPEVAREPLTQAERNLVYALRTFVRTRKQLLIQVAEAYYGVLSAMDSLEIAEQNYENLTQARERSEMLADADRVPKFQVDQARQNELSARASVINARAALQNREDQLKQQLGLPLTVTVELNMDDLQKLTRTGLRQPPMEREEAVAYALEHRLDLAIARGRLEDASRKARIARDDLKPTLDLVLSGSASSDAGSRLRGIRFDDGTYSAGIDAELPFDRLDETAAYRNALIDVAQAERGYEEMRDEITAQIRSVWRNLTSAEQNFRIQQLSVQLARDRVESTQLLFEAGRVNIRELLDAQESLIQARNSLTLALVNHRLNWLRLLYNLEQLDAEPDTLWSPVLELPSEPPDGDAP